MIETLPLEFQVPDSEEYRAVKRVLELIDPRRGRAAAISMHRIAEITGLQPRRRNCAISIADNVDLCPDHPVPASQLTLEF